MAPPVINNLPARRLLPRLGDMAACPRREKCRRRLTPCATELLEATARGLSTAEIFRRGQTPTRGLGGDQVVGPKAYKPSRPGDWCPG